MLSAYLSEEDLDAVHEQDDPITTGTEQTVTREEFLAELDEIRTKGGRIPIRDGPSVGHRSRLRYSTSMISASQESKWPACRWISGRRSARASVPAARHWFSGWSRSSGGVLGLLAGFVVFLVIIATATGD